MKSLQVSDKREERGKEKGRERGKRNGKKEKEIGVLGKERNREGER
jgi:hypothetical protein